MFITCQLTVMQHFYFLKHTFHEVTCPRRHFCKLYLSLISWMSLYHGNILIIVHDTKHWPIMMLRLSNSWFSSSLYIFLFNTSPIHSFSGFLVTRFTYNSRHKVFDRRNRSSSNQLNTRYIYYCCPLFSDSGYKRFCDNQEENTAQTFCIENAEIVRKHHWLNIFCWMECFLTLMHSWTYRSKATSYS